MAVTILPLLCGASNSALLVIWHSLVQLFEKLTTW